MKVIMKIFALTLIYYLLFSILFIGVQIYPVASAFGAMPVIEIPSSFNPVGSGARAIGRGGAFIAVADDATAASWNPGGLIQLKRKPELSIVISGFDRKEDNNFGIHPESSGLSSVFGGNINYFSLAGSFELFNRNMSLALTYQHLYDFNREWVFPFKLDTDREFSEYNWDYKQEGNLSALGFSYCVQVIPRLSMGFTLNFWKNGLTENKWEQKYNIKGSGIILRSQESFTQEYNKTEEYSFSGFNVNLGALYRINRKLTLGFVVKTPFKADIEYKVKEKEVFDYLSTPNVDNNNEPEPDIENGKIEMPMSCGIGFVYNFSDNLSISADFYRTEWDDFIYRDEKGREKNPITDISESDIDPTHQVRIGVEYLFINVKKRYVVPIRAGIFYDPAPSEGSPDNFYGFSLGSGVTIINWFSLDIAYQYRFGNDVGSSVFKDMQFSQDVHEHMIYLSMILYRF